MDNYMDIIKTATAAVKDIPDEKLKEIAFQKILDHALNYGSHHTKTSKIETSDTIKKKKVKTYSSPTIRANIRDVVKTAFAEVTANQPGTKALNSLKQKWEQYLWVLYVGKENGIDIMTNNEIAYILQENFSLGATEKQVNNLTFKAKTGHVMKAKLGDTRAWKILKDGIDLIKA